MVNNQAAQLRAEFVRLFAQTLRTRLNNDHQIRMLSAALVWFPYFFSCVLIPLYVNAVISFPIFLGAVIALTATGVYQYTKIAVIDTIETIAATEIVLNQHPSMVHALKLTRKAQWADVDAAYAY